MLPHVDVLGVQVSTYYLAHLVAIPVAGMLAFHRLLRFRKQPPHRFILALAAIIVAAVLGAVAFHYLVWAVFHLTTVGRIGPIPKGSTQLGALLGGGLVGLALVKHFGGPVGRVFDAGIPALPLGQAIGRLGCFLAGCCHGRPTTSWLAMTLPGEGSVWAPRFPTQLMSSAADAVIFVTLLLVERRGARRGGLPFEGFLTILFGLLYLGKRFLMEFIRDERPLVWGPFTWAHAVSMVGLVLAVSLLWLNLRRARASRP